MAEGALKEKSWANASHKAEIATCVARYIETNAKHETKVA